MTDLASDIDALFELIEGTVSELQDKDPNHELLKFAGPVLENESWTREVYSQYLEQFATANNTTVLQAKMNYFIALEKVLGKRE